MRLLRKVTYDANKWEMTPNRRLTDAKLALTLAVYSDSVRIGRVLERPAVPYVPYIHTCHTTMVWWYPFRVTVPAPSYPLLGLTVSPTPSLLAGTILSSLFY